MSAQNQIPIVIPAYEPDERLLKLLQQLKIKGIGPVVITDDGSGETYSGIFEKASALICKLGGKVLHHEENKGKGRALKTAFSYILEYMPEAIGVVTADSDGQHTVECISDIRKKLSENPDNLILGVRDFEMEGDDIPWKSRFGNRVTEKVFTYVAGLHVTDTQTGLRGIPRAFMEELLGVKGERFDFETRMLLESVNRFPIVELSIETIYESKENHQTHFHPIVDSWRIYKILGGQFLRYTAASLSSSIVDLVLFTVFCLGMKGVFPHIYVAVSTIVARMISAFFNYAVNYKLVFKSREQKRTSGGKYFTLAVCQMLTSAAVVTAGTWVFSEIPETVIKVVVDTVLFFCELSYTAKIYFLAVGSWYAGRIFRK